MSGYITFNNYTPMLLRQQTDPATDQRGRISNGWGTPIERQRLPDEALYPVSLVIQNVVVGSVILATTLGGTEIARTVAVAESATLVIPYFGAPRQVNVKVRKSSAPPFYQSFETQATITALGGSIFINQLSDES
jgi:hypothetical protein